MWKPVERLGHYDAQKGQRDRGDRASSKFIHDLNTLLWHACPVPGVIETMHTHGKKARVMAL